MRKESFLKNLRKAFEPPRFLAWPVCIVSFAFLFYVFYNGYQDSWISYIAYVLSAYSLVVIVFAAIRLYKSAKTGFEDNKLIVKIKGTKFYERYNSDVEFKSSVLLLEGSVINLLFMAFKAITGALYSSTWFYTIAGYYFVLVVIKGILFSLSVKATKKENGELFLAKRLSFLSMLLFLVNIPAIAIVVQVVFLNSSYIYPDYVIYLSAAHTFYTFTKAIIDGIKYRKVGKLAITFSKAINFDTAAMSLFALQTAMITTFSQNDEYFRLLMNTLTGSAVVILIALTSIFMLYISLKKRKELKNKEKSFE